MNNKLKNFYNNLSSKNNASLSDDAQLRVKNEIFSKLGNQLVEEPVSSRVTFSRIVSKGYIFAPIAIILFVTGTTMASANSLPGDPLYSVKRQVENVRLFITLNEEDKLDLKVDFAQKRLDEAQKTDLQGTADDANNDEVINDNSNGRTDEQKTDNSDSANRRSERQIKSREEADNALEFLNQTKRNWEQSGNSQRAQEIEERMQRYRNEVSNGLGRVQGDKIKIKE